MNTKKHTGQTLAYKRVSTYEQNIARQDYLDEGADRVFTDKVSSVKERPELERLLSYAREGDLIRVHSIDRFARSVKDLKIMIDDLLAKGVSIEFASENMTFTPNGDANVYADVMLSVLGAIYEFERKMMLIRQAEGLAKSRANGKLAGREPMFTSEQVEEMRALRESELPVSVIARRFETSRTSVYRALRGEIKMKESTNG